MPVAGPPSFAPAGGFSNDVQRGLRVKSIVMLLIGTAAFAMILPSCTRANNAPSFQLLDGRGQTWPLQEQIGGNVLLFGYTYSHRNDRSTNDRALSTVRSPCAMIILSKSHERSLRNDS